MKTIENKELIQYKQAVTEALYNYLQNKDDAKLANALYRVEINAFQNLGQELGKNIWFRFFKGDPLCTTIKDIIMDINAPKQLREWTLEKIEEAVKANSIEVYYS